jgi:hypothetical protein
MKGGVIRHLWMALLGRAVQVDPIKRTLKAPGNKLLKVKHGNRFRFCFQVQLAPLQLGIRARAEADMAADRVRWTDELERMRQELAAGAYSRSLFSSTWALFIG